MLPCPRRKEAFRQFGDPAHDKWHDIDNTCSYCGSLNPEYLMERIRRGDVELGPTDKNYKVYVKNLGGEKFKHTHGELTEEKVVVDGKEFTRKGPIKWITTESDETKFYFVHLNDEQKQEFVELYNRSVTENPDSMKLGYPGYFYRWPFFMGPKPKD